MKILRLAGTAFLILSLLSPAASVNAEYPEYRTPVSSSIQPALSAQPQYGYPGGMEQGWLGKVQRSLAAYEYHASENTQGIQAPNRAHNLRIYVSPGSSVAVGDVAPGGSVSHVWGIRGDTEGSGAITAGASSGGTSLDTVSHSLTVIK